MLLAGYINGNPLMQGEENLKFIFHMLRKIDDTAPSFSDIKRLHLPGFNEPKKVNLLL